MTVANKIYKGTIMTVAGSAFEPTRESSSEGSCDAIDCSGANDSDKIYFAGKKDWQGTGTVVGGNIPAAGNTVSVSIAWNGGGNESLGNCIVTASKITGSDGGVITGQITLKKTNP